MKKIYLFSLVLVFLASTFSAKAQVTGMPVGYITTAPAVSTDEAPVWYNLMATNTDVARVNRYMYWDGSSLKTDLFNSPGITDAIQNDKYLWRLEQGVTGAGYVVFVNKTSGKKMFADASIISNGIVGVADAGNEWKIAEASTVTTGTVAGQYCFNFEGSGIRYLNAGDAATIAVWPILVFNGAGSPAKSSGWFFYPVTATKTISYAQPLNGTVAVTATNGTSTPSAVTSAGNVLVGSVATVSVMPASGYTFHSLKVNGVDVTAQVTNNLYQFPVNTDATIVTDFSITTGIADSKYSNEVSPNPFRNTLNIENKLAGTTVYLYDLCGKQAMVSNEAVVNTSILPKGVYVIKFTTDDGTKTSKAVKD